MPTHNVVAHQRRESLLQKSSISRRKIVALATGSLAVMAGPLGRASSAAELPHAFAGSEAALIASRRHVVDALRLARRARGAAARTGALRQLNAALRLHDAVVETATGDLPVTSSQALYRRVAPDTVLASVIARELAVAPDRSAWTTRFADLEAVVQARIA